MKIEALMPVLVVLLGACSSQAGGDPTVIGEAQGRCAAVAQQRTEDAGLNGYTDEMQKAVYRQSLKDCLDWDAKHGAASP